MSDGYKQRQRERYKKQLEDAFDAYERREPASMDSLLLEVVKFAKRKMYGVEMDNPKLGTIRTVDDYAQDVMVAVWQGLESKSFLGGRPKFYAYVNKISHNTKQDFLAEIIHQRNHKVALTVPINNEYGIKEDEEDNPEIYDARDFDVRINIPASVQGIDLTICKLLLTEVRGKDGNHRGRNYSDIGRILEMTEDAVKKRMDRLRDRLKVEKEAEKNEQQRIKEDAERERRDSVSIGLAKLRGTKP